MIKVLICDLDGSLMNPSSGLYVKEEIKEKLIEIQKKQKINRLFTEMF